MSLKIYFRRVVEWQILFKYPNEELNFKWHLQLNINELFFYEKFNEGSKEGCSVCKIYKQTNEECMEVHRRQSPALELPPL